MRLRTVPYDRGSFNDEPPPPRPRDPLDLITEYAQVLRDPVLEDPVRHALADAIATHARWLQNALGTEASTAATVRSLRTDRSGSHAVIDLEKDRPAEVRAMPLRTRTIVICDAQPIARHGIRALLEAEPDLRVVGETDSMADVVELLRRTRADCIVLDADATDQDMTVVRAIATSGVLVAVFSARSDLLAVIAALEAGAAAYILTSSPPGEIVSAVRGLRRGETYVSPSLVGPLAHRASPTGRRRTVALTTRERQILRLLADGLSARRISSTLGITERTVQTHLGNLYRRAGVDNRVDAIMWGVREGIVEPITRGTR